MDQYGSLRIAKVLVQQGLNVNRNHISRLIRLMGLCPKGPCYRY
ncbi:MAG: transposase [Lacrimispora celerecrescens]|nr:transposase [Lacrimispora celerecrescens]